MECKYRVIVTSSPLLRNTHVCEHTRTRACTRELSNAQRAPAICALGREHRAAVLVSIPWCTRVLAGGEARPFVFKAFLLVSKLSGPDRRAGRQTVVGRKWSVGVLVVLGAGQGKGLWGQGSLCIFFSKKYSFSHSKCPIQLHIRLFYFIPRPPPQVTSRVRDSFI